MHLKLIPCGSELYRCACIKKKKKNYRCERVGVCGVTCRNWGSLQTSPFKLSVCCIFALFSLPKPQYINPFSLSSLLYTPLLFFSTYINNPLINSTILFSNFNNLFNLLVDPKIPLLELLISSSNFLPSFMLVTLNNLTLTC